MKESCPAQLRGALIFLCLVAWSVTSVPAQDLSGQVLVVYNTASAASREVADYYLARRHIPRTNLCGIAPATNDYLSWGDFLEGVRNPIRNCLAAVSAKQRITYIVLAYDLPFRIEQGIPEVYYYPAGDPEALPGRAVDSYLIDLWEAYGTRVNPYYVAADTKNGVYQDYVPLTAFNRQSDGPPVYSVWRLDGATPALAMGLVDKALQAEAGGLRGRACFDRNRGLFNVLEEDDNGYLAVDWDLYRAAEFTRIIGWDTTEDSAYEEFGTAPAPARCDNAALYAGWYSYNEYHDVFSWAPGAIGFHIDSASAAHPRAGNNWAANAVRQGITVTTGAVDEPFTEPYPEADQIVRALLQGANVGDAFLRSTRFTDWQFINLGDPLYRPFAQAQFPPPEGRLPFLWHGQDLGSVGAPGYSRFYGGNFALAASGDGLLDTADSCQFAARQLPGDGEIVARLARPENTTAAGYAAFAGVMLRARPDPDAPFVALGVASGENYRLIARTTAGTAGAILQTRDYDDFMWVRLVRRGNAVSAYTSQDGRQWVWLDTVTLALPANLQAGLVLSSGTNNRRNVSWFDHVQVKTKSAPASEVK